MVELRQIDLSDPSTSGNLQELIDEECTTMATDGHKLVSTFVLGNTLILVFVT